MLLACYFNMPDYSEGGRLSPIHPTNLYITPGPDANINPDNSVLEVNSLQDLRVVCLLFAVMSSDG